MSFEKLNKEVLEQVADHFDVELEEKATRKDIILALATSEPPVTYAMYKEAFPDPEDLPEVKKEEKPTATDAKFSQTGKGGGIVLIKMVRGNPYYETCGLRFTREHPYLPVPTDTADWILANQYGFRRASAEEVEAFYS